MSPEIRERITNLCTDEHPDHLEGWATPEKALAMCELIEEVKPRVIVEVGVFGGRSLIPQAMALRENGAGVIIGIDPWELESVLEGNPDEASRQWWTENVNLDLIHKNYFDAIVREGLLNWIITVRARSQITPVLFPMIDILHVDGNHTELVSRRDVNLFLPRVRKHGWIWFDDIDWQTTKGAVEILEKRCTKVKQVGNCALFQNRKPLVGSAKEAWARRQQQEAAAAPA